MADVAAIALRQFHLRLRAAKRRVAQRQWSAEEADPRLFPWLAAALRCGAPVDQLHPDLQAQYQDRLATGLTDSAARHLVALQFASDAAVAAELASARDAAIEAGSDTAADLAAMAARLCAPPHEPRKDAA